MVNHTCAQKEEQRKHLDSLVPVIQMFSLGCGDRFPYLHGLVRGGGNGMDHGLQHWLRQTTTTAAIAITTATTSEKITGYFPSVFVLGRIVVKRFFGHGVVKFMPISNHLHPSGTLCQYVPEKKQFVCHLNKKMECRRYMSTNPKATQACAPRAARSSKKQQY